MFAQRTVFVECTEGKTFLYNNAPHQQIEITDVPDSNAVIELSFYGKKLRKRLPDGASVLHYYIGEGNNDDIGIWYRGTQKLTQATKVTYSNEFVQAPNNIPDSLEFQALKETESPSDLNIDSISGRTGKVIEELAETENEDTEIIDVWAAAAEAEFEFDRVRVFREYFSQKSHCDFEDIDKAMGILRYDPSRLELGRTLGEHCAEEVWPKKEILANKHFAYPHFRQQFIDIFSTK